MRARSFPDFTSMTRRSFATILGVPAALGQSVQRQRPGSPLASGEIRRFYDPVTENVVARLTDPRTNSLLPSPQNRFVSARNHFLVFSSDRTGQMAPFHLDLRNGALRQLAQPERLDPASLCMDERERWLYYLDGQSLHEVALGNLKHRTIAEDVTAFALGASAADLVVLRKGRLERFGAGGTALVTDNAAGVTIRPNGTGCAFWRGDAGEMQWWYAAFPPPERKPKLLTSGPIVNPIWSPRGDSLLFLRQVIIRSNYPDVPPITTAEIHEVSPESSTDRRVAPTSQFAAFAPNANGSVFVGASRSVAQPTVLLLLRTTAREFTLCEHKASNPATVSPVFSPNSQRVYFQSDREGKWALYSVNVEKLIEATNI